MKKEQLASRGVLFQNELEVKPFGIAELSLISEACVSNDPQPYFDALMSSINVEANLLTLPDVFSLGVYHRFNSMNGQPINLIWKCTGSLAQDKGGNLHKLDTLSENSDIEVVDIVKCNRNNHAAFNLENFPVKHLPEQLNLPEELDFPRATLYAEYIRLMKEPRLAKLIPAVIWIKEGNTIQDKLAHLEQQEDLTLYNLAAKYAVNYEHGVKSTLTAVCEKCGTAVQRKVYIDQHSFFK